MVDFIGDAELVVLAEVIDVSYADSEGEVQIPHTYVTYAIDEVLKGHYEEPHRNLVLRLAGGVGRLEIDLTDLHNETLPAEVEVDEERGVAFVEDAIFGVSETTLFDPGERSVLMIRRNGEVQCPLVGCADGRFRVVNGFVFTEDGRELSIHPNGEIVVGGAHSLYEVEHNLVGGYEVRYAGGGDASGSGDGSEGEGYRVYPAGESLRLDDFLAWIRLQVEAESNIGGEVPSLAVPNLVPGEPFQVPAPTAKPFGGLQEAPVVSAPEEEGA